jgi:hypothetical protein
LAKRHQEILAKLDPVAVTRYQITEKDLRTIEKYLQIIQRNLISKITSIANTGNFFKLPPWSRPTATTKPRLIYNYYSKAMLACLF